MQGLQLWGGGIKIILLFIFLLYLQSMPNHKSSNKFEVKYMQHFWLAKLSAIENP